MTNNKNKMIDPADVQALLEAYGGTAPMLRDFENLVNGLRDLLPKPDYPEDMLGMWAEHPVYGRVLVCSAKPGKGGLVKIVAAEGLTKDGTAWERVSVSSLRFEEQLEEQHPHTLTTLEDYENAPDGTIVEYTNNNMPYVKQSYLWGGVHDRMTLGELDGNSSRVLRWGWGE